MLTPFEITLQAIKWGVTLHREKVLPPEEIQTQLVKHILELQSTTCECCAEKLASDIVNTLIAEIPR